MKFNWAPRSLKEWRHYLAKTQNTNWMQTWNYAEASRTADHFISRLALIEKDGQPVGMMCVQEIKLGPVQLINLKRGPLWFAQPTETLFLEFAKTFRQEFPKKLLQRLRWIPEIELGESALSQIEKIGFKLRKENFLTAWLDLQQSVEKLRAGLNQKWRNCLNKAERAQLDIRMDKENTQLELFLNFAEAHQREKSFSGPTKKFLRTEFLNSAKTNEHFFLWAFVQEKPVAGIAIVRHGSTTAYRIGWNTDLGRKLNAHYILLWKAILISKELGHHQFDLGGLLPDSAVGVTHFKQGLGGRETKRVTLSN